ncbi:hypothetical protein C2I17_21245 [Niallia circulans]|uniref:hypothetical protein n=1 Tax=Niallia circulans TaxID=1397 RepID=UPI00201E166D|nr:hypothetical protein [Niallia circulans]UQZ76866.1 hypothetical protein C2I17_21245 [Niallia circulans]
MEFIMSLATLGFMITLVYAIVLKIRKKPSKKMFVNSLIFLGVMFVASFFVDDKEPIDKKVATESKEATATPKEKKKEESKKEESIISEEKVLAEIKVGMTYPKEYNKAKEKLKITPEENISIGNGNVGSVIKTKEGYVVANIVAENIDISDAKIAEINTFKNKEEVKKYETEMIASAEKEVKKPSFDFAWDEFEHNWITVIPEIKGSEIENFSEKDSTDQGDNIVINAKITDYLHLLGDLEPKSEKVKYLSIMGEPTSDNGKNSNIILAFGNLIAVSNPELTTEERRDILMDKLKFNSGDLSNLDETYDYKGVTYKATTMAGILTVSISPKE